MHDAPTTSIFDRQFAGIGRLSLSPFDLDRHTATLHSWVTQPYARYWGMLNATVDGVRAEYHRIQESGHHHAFLGDLDGEPRFLAERYEPVHDPVGTTYAPAPGDIGMHVLVAPPENPIAGFTTAVFRTVMDFVFADPSVERVVVEPDVRNTKIHALNHRMGFRQHSVVELPGKQAWLSFCTREQYDHARHTHEAG